MNQRGFLAVGPMLYAALAALAVIIALSGYAYVQTQRLDACKAEYAAFVADVKAKGEEQERRTKETIERDRKAKEKADAENKRLRSANASLAVSLRESRASVGYVPPAAPGSASPNRACFDRAALERAIAELDAGVSGIVGKGDGFRVDLDSAKAWAQ